MGIEETYLSIKTMYISAQLTSDSTVRKWNIPFKIRNKTRMSSLATFIWHSFKSPSDRNQIESNKRNLNWKLNCHCFQVTWYSTQKIPNVLLDNYLLELSEFGKSAGYKINIQKCVVICAHWQAIREIKETIQFTITPKKEKK